MATVVSKLMKGFKQSKRHAQRRIDCEKNRPGYSSRSSNPTLGASRDGGASCICTLHTLQIGCYGTLGSRTVENVPCRVTLRAFMVASDLSVSIEEICGEG